jgi:hypothetical protein
MRGISPAKEDVKHGSKESHQRVSRWQRDREPGKTTTRIARADVLRGRWLGVTRSWRGGVMYDEEDVGTPSMMSGHK